ncbi:MAG: cobalt-precorrin 5A hydrolase [Deltaproteobacteria bacterium]|nr:cobalt-precorrin 5A hydrolase [Deltaproteobacteria bacterium]
MQDPGRQTAIYALTPRGGRLGRMLAHGMNGDLFMPSRLAESYGAIPFEGLREAVAANFRRYPRQIFISAAGIVVRVIAPHLSSKDKDPAVVVLDQEGRYAVSLLSGHLGGANELAGEVASLTGGRAVITTATDAAGLTAIDVLAREKEMAILNLGGVKAVNMAILSGEPVQVFDPEDRLFFGQGRKVPFPMMRIAEEKEWVKGRPGVWVTWRRKEPETTMMQLVLHPRCLIAGIGCNRGTEGREIIDLVVSTFERYSLALKALKCLASIEAKRDEEGLKRAAEELGVPAVFVDLSEIRSVSVPHPSVMVEKHMGVQSVCEATAIVKSGNGRLLIPKTKSRNATLAVALEG